MNAQPKPDELRALKLVEMLRDAGLDPRRVTVGKVVIDLGPVQPEDEPIDWRVK